MLRRFVGMVVFALMVLTPGMTKGLQKPDVVMGSTVHLLGAWAGWRLAKRHGVPFIYEIRDVWPDTLVHLGRMKPKGVLTKMMERLSVTLAQRATLVVSPLPSIDRYLIDHNIDATKFLWVSNGFEGKAENDSLAKEVGTDFVFMYLGAHGNANALESILVAFDQACSKLPENSLRMRLVGSGPLKPRLIDFSKSLSYADRITFEDQIRQEEVISRAREADCLVVNMHDNPVYEYGVSLNKLFTYLYAHRPVVFGCNQQNNPISDSGGGIVVAADDRPALAKAMMKIFEMDKAGRHELARRGYQHALENYSYEALTRRLVGGLDQVLEQR